MSKTFDQGKDEVAKLCQYFATNRQSFLAPGVKEAHVRQLLIDPFFEALGWDVRNVSMAAPQYREVIPEDSLDVEGQQKAPDYTFRVGTLPKFYVEAKKCGVNISADPAPAYQLRRYGFSAKLALSILTDFDEIGVYDCASRPRPGDKASHARIQYLCFTEYPDRWREIWDVFSRAAVWSGTFDQYAASKRKRGTSEVDSEFLKDIEGWRDVLARNLALRNSDLSADDLNAAVQRIIDRIVFLRMAEDRGLESYGQLLKLCEQPDIYGRFMSGLCRKADQKYNSGLFHFQKEPGVSDAPDPLTPRLAVDDNALKPILQSLYFEHGCPYHFGVLPVEILGTVYERFLGKVIRLTAGHQAKVEEKPEVRKAGGVYYTPTYVVNYIVQNTIGKQIEGKSPADLAGNKTTPPFRVLDMACGSGSFLLGAYQFLLDHCLKWHQANPSPKHAKAVYQNAKGETHLTIAERKRILTTHIYGVDIDRQAVETTKLSLLLKALEGENDTTLSQQMTLFHERALPNLSDNIKCGNSLIASDFSMVPEDLVRVHAFDWPVQFPNAMKVGGFDAIIGNPPYIQLSMKEFRDAQVNAYLKESFGMSGGRLNTFIFFIEKARCLTRNGGEFGFIVPNTLLTQEYYEEARQRLVQNTWIKFLVSPREQVFRDAVVENIILIAQRTAALAKNASLESTFANLMELRIDSIQRVQQNEFAKNFQTSFVVPADPELAALRTKLNSQPLKFGSLLNINQAIALKHDRAACLTDNPISSNYHEILDGRHIGRYFTGDSPNYFKFDIVKIHSCKREDIFLAPEKILMRRVGDRLIGTLDEKQKFALNTLVVMTPLEKCEYELKFILGLFNSHLMNFFYTRFLKSTKKIFSEIQAHQVAQLPVPKLDLKNHIDLARHDKLVLLVEKMLALTPKLRGATSESEKAVLQNAVTTTDAEIDRLVYELYGLTEEEIKIVEGEC
jgi:hypothetical protein